MLFTPQQTIAEHIIDQLAYQPRMTVKEIHDATQPHFKKHVSRRGLHKALKVLLDEEVIVRIKQRYNLSFSWLNRIKQFIQLVDVTYLEDSKYHKNINSLLEGERQRYKFLNPVVADAFWDHIVALLVTSQQNIPYYSYCKNFWFFLVHEFSTNKHYETLLQNSEFFTLIGSRSDINLWAQNKLPKHKNAHYYCLPKPLNEPLEITKTVVGNFVITFKIQQELASKIDQLFYKVQLDLHKDDPPREQFTALLKQKSTTTIIVEHNIKKAEKFRGKIKRYF